MLYAQRTEEVHRAEMRRGRNRVLEEVRGKKRRSQKSSAVKEGGKDMKRQITSYTEHAEKL